MIVRGTLSAKSLWGVTWSISSSMPTRIKAVKKEWYDWKRSSLRATLSRVNWNKGYISKPSTWAWQPDGHGFKSQFCYLPVLASSWPLRSFFFSQAQNRHNIIRGLPGAFVTMKQNASDEVLSTEPGNKWVPPEGQPPFPSECKFSLLMKMCFLSPWQKAGWAFLGKKARVRSKILNNLFGPGLAVQNWSQS